MPAVTPVAAARVQSAIALAANRTGVDFGYLLGQAKLESGLNASARAGTSSATGLYQFIEQSWLAVVKKHGGEHGLGWAANNIQRLPSGRYTVGDAGTRQAILNLRTSPEVASLMAAEHAGDNKAVLERKLGRPATGTDLYMAHFLGLGGASKFLTKLQNDPRASGADMFPQAAAANRNVFYDKAGQPRSLTAIYQRFTDKLGASAASAGQTAIAHATKAIELDGATIINGAGESSAQAMEWAATTLGRIGRQTIDTASVLRPTPDTARLAYLMLAGMGTR
ncbi:MAG: lytic transglycosylase protein [Sphingomonas bacterium]|uniref:lytic transglycosylase domain-containing protein n=1 Tax=Sphingomonas bacterium TaxID=1895847 RepID=UPI00262F8D8C|nr:lytic transglycosylase domain-containing protein [Sphingomonas bacterium]MDB5694991.1 lytic transglycosylase protein [Sphingomonas bacterium]